MFNIENMIKSSDFSDLISSTKEEREKAGGDYHIYNQLIDYIYFGIIKEIILEVFKDNEEILAHLHEHTNEKDTDTQPFIYEDCLDNIIMLPE